MTSCLAFASVQGASMPELLLGAPLPLRVESSSNHKRRATCGLIDTKCNRADDSRCVHTYRSLFLSLAAYTYTYTQAYVEALLWVTVDGDCEDTKT